VEILDEFSELIALKISIGNAETIIKKRHSDVSKPTLWRWKKLVSGHHRQYWEALLAPQYEGRNRGEIHPQAWAFFRHQYGQQSELNATVAYRLTVEAAAANGWGALPSCKTFERRWDSDVPDDQKLLSRKGKTALKESLPHLKRDFTTIEIHGGWESDGSIADTTCSWSDGFVGRPWIVLVRDIRTRMPLALKVYTSTNAALVIDAFRKAVMLTGTRPEFFHLDNGTEYSNNAFTGGQKSTVRYSVERNQPVGVLTRMGIKVKWATPYHGAAKSIESFWNVIKENVDKPFFKAYTGRNTVERPEDWDPDHAVPIKEYTERLVSVISAWAKGELGVHRGQGMNGMSPLELYNHLMPSHVPHPATAEQLRSMRPLVFRRILSQQRVFRLTLPGFGAVEYWPDDQNEAVRRGYTYDIMPDPTDPEAPALIYDGARYMGEAAYKSHTPYFDETAGGEIAQRRSSAVKKAGAGLRAVAQQVNGTAPPLALCDSLPALLQPALLDVLKLPKEQPHEPPPRVIELENGDLKDTVTGGITTKKAVPQAPSSDARTDADYLEQLAAEQRRKNSPSWLDEQTELTHREGKL